MDFCYLSAQKSLESQLEKNAYNILEPKTDLEKLDAEHLPVHTVLLVPGLAFSRSGARLGRGKGYYDRLLPLLTNAYKLGVCFDFQKLPGIPADEHDMKMDEII